MKQWLNTPVTYGCMIRVLLLCAFAFLLLVSAIDLAFNVGGARWTAISAAILIVLGIIIGPVGSVYVYLSTDKRHQNELSPSTSVVSHDITFEQAYELLTKREEDFLKTSPNQENGSLLVSTQHKEKEGITVYLLPRGEFLRCKSSHKSLENNKQKKTGTITGTRSGPYLLFVARFRNLPEGRYNAWIGWGIDDPKSVPVQIAKDCVSELNLEKLI